VRVFRVQVGPLESNCWVVSDGAGTAVVIDPGDEPDAIMDAVGKDRVGAIILTHCHFDHLGAASTLVSTTGAPLMIHSMDAGFVHTAVGTGGVLFGFPDSVAPTPDRELEDGEVVNVGELSFEVMLTPGHTPGSICLLTRDTSDGLPHLFSGDTLFAGSIGRTDFPRGDSRAMIRSLAGRIAGLTDETVVHPGHGPETTIGREKRVNPFFPRA
jgi:hydroxyacylglutathione hydrolase